jgi:hypothetical protein
MTEAMIEMRVNRELGDQGKHVSTRRRKGLEIAASIFARLTIYELNLNGELIW